MTIETTLKKKRKTIGLTQEKVAEQAQISTRNYQAYEAGKRVPNVYTAQLIAKALSIENVKEIFPLSEHQ